MAGPGVMLVNGCCLRRLACSNWQHATRMVWQRPADPLFPRVYKRLELTRANTVERYVIQDLPPEHDREAIELMVDRFIRDEPTCKSTNAIEDPYNVSEMREYWEKCVSHRLSIACYRLEQDGTRRLVGLNMCSVCEKGDPEPDIQCLRGAAWRQILHTLVVTNKTADVYSVLDVERYLGASGLFVLPELRGRGLAVEIVKAREPLCLAVGLEASVTVFTALASQHVAAKCGFKVLGEVPYVKLELLGYTFPDIDSPSAMLMGRRYT